MSAADVELFHSIGDPGSAAARRFVTRHHLAERIRFRNVHYDEVQRDLIARGGSAAPALWDGRALHQGEAAVLAALARLVEPTGG